MLVTLGHSRYKGWKILPQDFIVALYRAIFFFGMKMYVVARICSPLRSRINKRGEKRRAARWKDSFPRRSGVVKVAFDPEGLPISHLPYEGDFVSRHTGRGRVSRVSDIYILDWVLCDLLSPGEEEKKREATEEGIRSPEWGSNFNVLRMGFLLEG